MSYCSLEQNVSCGVESIIRSRGMISLSELACLRKSLPASLERQLVPLVREGRVECIRPVAQAEPGKIYYRWREASDARHVWQIKQTRFLREKMAFARNANQNLMDEEHTETMLQTRLARV
ncbi:MAG: hypothetical protein PHP44_08700 [Kiritimatiellae bacterium]|nr:hypothetical protein [Kiritimatiellia bacterium]MDD4736172.1 hypothetical protein [Kiritimatiellia bacterium]